MRDTIKTPRLLLVVQLSCLRAKRTPPTGCDPPPRLPPSSLVNMRVGGERERAREREREKHGERERKREREREKEGREDTPDRFVVVVVL